MLIDWRHILKQFEFKKESESTMTLEEYLECDRTESTGELPFSFNYK